MIRKPLGKHGKQLYKRLEVAVKEPTLLEAYCRSYEEFIWACETLDKEPRVIKANNGYMQKHPAVDIMDKAKSSMLKYAKQLKLDIPPEVEGNPYV